jgi:hypothetical protein
MGEKKIRLVLIKPQSFGESITASAGSVVEVPELLAEMLIAQECAVALRGERSSRVLEPPRNAAYSNKPQRVKRLWKHLD